MITFTTIKRALFYGIFITTLLKRNENTKNKENFIAKRQYTVFSKANLSGKGAMEHVNIYISRLITRSGFLKYSRIVLALSESC